MADTYNLILVVVRVWLGVMIFAYGARDLLGTIRGNTVAQRFEALGVRPGKVHAWAVAITELVLAELLIAGLLTPIAAGILGALMLVSLVTEARTRGMLESKAGPGWEQVVTVGVLALTLGAIGPGEWSLDDAVGLSFPFQTPDALLITGLVAIGVAGAFLALFWRPAKVEVKTKASQPMAKAA